jgi:DnaJ-class molecular chaperone
VSPSFTKIRRTILIAVQILGTPEKRSAYDKYGSASQQDGFDPNMFGGGAGGFGGFQDFGSAFGGRPGSSGHPEFPGGMPRSFPEDPDHTSRGLRAMYR